MSLSKSLSIVGLMSTASVITAIGNDSNYDGWDNVIWQNMNPGAGGNIQSIDLDPTVPGRIFYSSDMEGAYRSDDYGKSWDYIGEDFTYSYTNFMTSEPGNPDRVYAGTVGSLEISDDGGKTFDRVKQIKDSIGQVVVHPEDPNIVYALPGERQRWDGPTGSQNRGPWGKRDFYYSRDRGQSWKIIEYAEGIGRRDIFSFDISVHDPDVCILGAITGVYRSSDGGQSWEKLSSPSGVGDGIGACLSPDGSIVYAAFRAPKNGKPGVVTDRDRGGMSVEGESHLYALPLSIGSQQWVNLSEQGEGFRVHRSGVAMFWRPRIDPRSTADRHMLLIGTYRPQHGLWEITADWKGDELKHAQWSQILDYNPDELHGSHGKRPPFDIGWEYWGINAEDYYYTPLDWGKREIFTTGGQTIYTTDLEVSDYTKKWEPRYTRLVNRYGNGVRSYRTRGANCVFVFDADQYGAFAAQSNADNCLMESFDSGYSWTEDTKPGTRLHSRSNAVTVIRELETPMVVAHMAVGWGAMVRQDTNALYAKRLTGNGLEDEWVLLAGGLDRLAGITRDEFTSISYHPENPKEVLIGTRFSGVFMIEDVEALYEAAVSGRTRPAVKALTRYAAPPKPVGVKSSGGGAYYDPNDPDVFWLQGQESVWRATRNGDEWQWHSVLKEQVPDLVVWDHNGNSAVAVFRDMGEFSDVIELSLDDGRTWTELIEFEDVQSLRSPKWYTDDEIKLGGLGLVADGSHLYFCYNSDQAYRRPYGLFRATLEGSRVVDIEDFTADLPYAYPVKSKIVEDHGEKFLLFCSRGNGLFRRRLD